MRPQSILFRVRQSDPDLVLDGLEPLGYRRDSKRHACHCGLRQGCCDAESFAGCHRSRIHHENVRSDGRACSDVPRIGSKNSHLRIDAHALLGKACKRAAYGGPKHKNAYQFKSFGFHRDQLVEFGHAQHVHFLWVLPTTRQMNHPKREAGRRCGAEQTVAVCRRNFNDLDPELWCDAAASFCR